MNPRTSGGPAACLLPAVLALAVSTSAQAQLSPRSARVEVRYTKAPTPVLADGKRALAYELHITNLGPGAIALDTIVVRDDAGRPVAEFRDSALTALLQPMGATGGDARRIEAGARTIAYMWLASEPSVGAPPVLRHRFVFDLLDTADIRRDRGRQAAVDGFVVPVATTAPLVIRSPLDSGTWVLGGASNMSAHRRSLVVLDGSATIAQRFAIDFVKIGPNGNTSHDDDHKNENFWGFGQPVHSVAAGEVVAAVDSIADHAPHSPIPPVTPATLPGNYVTVRIDASHYATYAHLQHGSVRVHPGQHVAAGQVIALLGTTGQTTGPHLHFQITDGPSVLGSEGVPFELAAYTSMGTGFDYEVNKHANVPRRREMPLDNDVVAFPPKP